MRRRSRSIAEEGKPSLNRILIDRGLASLGDALINFVYSVALSRRTSKPSGRKVKGTLLAEALRRADLRKHLPSSLSSHELADATEALLAYAWLNSLVTLEECVEILQENESAVEGLTELVEKVKDKFRFS